MVDYIADGAVQQTRRRIISSPRPEDLKLPDDEVRFFRRVMLCG